MAATSRDYYELLEVANNPEAEEHEEIREWLGEGFDPSRFDLQKVNAALRRLKV